MEAIIFIACVFLLSFFIGYKTGGYFNRKENRLLHRQLELQKDFSAHWAREATGKNELSKQVATQQSQNTTMAIQSFIQLMQSFQQKQSEGFNQEEKEKMEKIINQVKSNFG